MSNPDWPEDAKARIAELEAEVHQLQNQLAVHQNHQKIIELMR